MVPVPLACDANLLRLSLEERLSEVQEEALDRHLSQCEHCQRELERLAGGQQAWSKVGSALKSDAEHQSSAARLCGESETEAERADRDDEAAADFAVDFLEPSPDSEALGRLGDIDVVEVIGRGGMGLVLKGHQQELKRLVAVKVLAPHLAVSGAARKRFAREAQAAAAILHPNVMPILTVSSAGKLPYLVMPFLAGESLEQRIRRIGPLDLADILRIGVQAAQGLAAAHAQGLIHRDVKPANILLERGVERALLTDFGLARAIDDASITRTGLIAGTPQYMSPEQARGEPLDARSDLFSLGSVLYTMATGRPPFRAESTYGILRRIADDEPRSPRDVNPEIPAWVAAIIGKLLAKSPADRFASATEVASLLERCLAHVQQPVSVPLPEECQPPETPAGDTPPTASPRRALRAAGAALVGVCLIALLVAGWQLLHPPAPQLAGDPGQSPERVVAGAALPAESHWDQAAVELGGLLRDGGRFEVRARQMWDKAAHAGAAGHPAEGWDPDNRSRTLANLTGWVLAWDQTLSRSDVERRPILRVFPDGRILTDPSVGDPLSEGRLSREEVDKLCAYFAERGTPRRSGALKVFDTLGEGLDAAEFEELQSQLRTLEFDYHLGDPLPTTLWDQDAERLTVVREAKVYDLLSIVPPHPERPDPQGLSRVANLTPEVRARLQDLVYLAIIGSREERSRLVDFANNELRKRHPATPIRLGPDHLRVVVRGRDGSLVMRFDFSNNPQQQSYPSGELTIRVPRDGRPFVNEARYSLDAKTDDHWGRRVAKESP